jgi:MOSC domain-containing protein YiiM
LSVCINSARTGFYFRVLSEGIVQAGDRIEIDYSNDTAPTVEEVHRLCYLDKKNIDGLTKAVQCNSLAKVWKDEFENRISRLAAKLQQ